MPVHVDFSSAPEIVAGVYPVVVKSCKEDTSASGNDVVKASFQITEGEYEGTVVFATFSLQAHALFAIRGFLKALGKDTSESLDFDCEEAIGAEMEITVKIDPEFGPGVKKCTAL